MSILYRLPEKLRKSLRVKTLPVEAMLEDSFLDWSVSAFTTEDKFEYIALINTSTLYSTVFQTRKLHSLEEFGTMAAKGLHTQFFYFALRQLYNEKLAAHVNEYRFAKALDASTTGFVNNVTRRAKSMLERDESIENVCYQLNNEFVKIKEGILNQQFFTSDQLITSLWKKQKSHS